MELIASLNWWLEETAFVYIKFYTQVNIFIHVCINTFTFLAMYLRAVFWTCCTWRLLVWAQVEGTWSLGNALGTPLKRMIHPPLEPLIAHSSRGWVGPHDGLRICEGMLEGPALFGEIQPPGVLECKGPYRWKDSVSQPPPLQLPLPTLSSTAFPGLWRD